MKVGDLVKMIGSFSGDGIAMIISLSACSTEWYTLLHRDEIVEWPVSQLKAINGSR